MGEGGGAGLGFMDDVFVSTKQIKTSENVSERNHSNIFSKQRDDKSFCYCQ